MIESIRPFMEYVPRVSSFLSGATAPLSQDVLPEAARLSVLPLRALYLEAAGLDRLGRNATDRTNETFRSFIPYTYFALASKKNLTETESLFMSLARKTWSNDSALSAAPQIPYMQFAFNSDHLPYLRGYLKHYGSADGLLKQIDKLEMPSVILIGDPGGGKTFIMNCLANSMDIPLIGINASVIADKLEAKLGEVAADAKGPAKKTDRCLLDEIIKEVSSVDIGNGMVILFIDEIDRITQRRYAGDNYTPTGDSTITYQVLTEIERFEDKHPNIFVTCASNASGGMDPAAVRSGRINRIIVFGKPDETDRREFFDLFIKIEQPDLALSEEQLSQVVEKSKGLIMNSLLIAVNSLRMIKSRNGTVTFNDLLATINREAEHQSIRAEGIVSPGSVQARLIHQSNDLLPFRLRHR